MVPGARLEVRPPGLHRALERDRGGLPLPLPRLGLRPPWQPDRRAGAARARPDADQRGRTAGIGQQWRDYPSSGVAAEPIGKTAGVQLPGVGILRRRQNRDSGTGGDVGREAANRALLARLAERAPARCFIATRTAGVCGVLQHRAATPRHRADNPTPLGASATCPSGCAHRLHPRAGRATPRLSPGGQAARFRDAMLGWRREPIQPGSRIAARPHRAFTRWS